MLVVNIHEAKTNLSALLAKIERIRLDCESVANHNLTLFDRFIIATAELHNLQVVTTDKIFKQYGISTLH